MPDYQRSARWAGFACKRLVIDSAPRSLANSKKIDCGLEVFMRIEKMFLMLAAIGLVASVFVEQAQASTGQKRSRAQSPSARSSKTNMKTDSKEEPIFAC